MRGTKYAWLLVTLIAVGCGDSGIDQAVDELCFRMRSCFGEVGEDACQDAYRETVGDEVSEKCADAFSGYILCLSDLSCEELQDIDDAVCVDRIDRGEVVEACISD